MRLRTLNIAFCIPYAVLNPGLSFSRSTPASAKTPFRRPPKRGKKRYKVHPEVTRLERHATFRRSISLDDVDYFDALKSHGCQRHEFTTSLLRGLRSLFHGAPMSTSCQSHFLCDVIWWKRTPILSFCHLAAFTVPHRAVSRPSCGPAGSGT